MRISCIQNYSIAPAFGIRRRNTNYITNPMLADSYMSDISNKRIDNSYEKMKAQVGIVTPDDVRGMAYRISKKTGTNTDDVYIAMGILSQYSSYRSLKDVRDYLQNDGISLVSNLMPYYSDKRTKSSPCLTNVMHYISLRNFDYAKDSSSYTRLNKALFLDSDLTKLVKEMPESQYQKFYQNYFSKDNVKLIYLENFENGYNFLTQKGDFEQFTIHKIQEAKQISRENNVDFKSALYILLNGKILNELDLLGINYTKFSPKIAYSPEKIADNLNPVIPTKKEFVSIIDKIASDTAKNENEYNQNVCSITDFIDNANVVISPKQYNTYLQEMHAELSKYLEKCGKTQDDVYYLIPSKAKSFVLINYQYQKTNGIKNPKNIYIDASSDDYINLKNKIKPGSVLLFLDDCTMSGLSLTKEMFAYNNVNKFIPKNSDINIIFAPMYGTEIGINRIKKVMKQVHRDDNDFIICPHILPDNAKSINDESILSQNIPKNEDEFTTSLILPYMGPDSNFDILVPLYEKFFISPNAQKIPIDSFDYISNSVFG